MTRVFRARDSDVYGMSPFAPAAVQVKLKTSFVALTALGFDFFGWFRRTGVMAPYKTAGREPVYATP